MTVTDVIATGLDGLLLLAFLVAVLCVAAAVEMAAICGLVSYFEWRDHRHQARQARRRPGYITDEYDHRIVGTPWRNQ